MSISTIRNLSSKISSEFSKMKSSKSLEDKLSILGNMISLVSKQNEELADQLDKTLKWNTLETLVRRTTHEVRVLILFKTIMYFIRWLLDYKIVVSQVVTRWPMWNLVITRNFYKILNQNHPIKNSIGICCRKHITNGWLNWDQKPFNQNPEWLVTTVVKHHQFYSHFWVYLIIHKCCYKDHTLCVIYDLNHTLRLHLW